MKKIIFLLFLFCTVVISAQIRVSKEGYPVLPKKPVETTLSDSDSILVTKVDGIVRGISFLDFKTLLPSGGGASNWGDLGGTLSNQADLQTALDDKQNNLVSGTNIKTINNESLLGSGNITITGGGSITVVDSINISSNPTTSAAIHNAVGSFNVRSPFLNGVNVKTQFNSLDVTGSEDFIISKKHGNIEGNNVLLVKDISTGFFADLFSKEDRTYFLQFSNNGVDELLAFHINTKPLSITVSGYTAYEIINDAGYTSLNNTDTTETTVFFNYTSDLSTGGGSFELVNDLTPELGGNMEANSFDIKNIGDLTASDILSEGIQTPTLVASNRFTLNTTATSDVLGYMKFYNSNRFIPSDATFLGSLNHTLEEGEVYWNSTDNRLKAYDGTSWKNFLLEGDNIKSGATANRPSTPVTGQQFFDTTLGYPIWYDGTNWVDATGTTR